MIKLKPGDSAPPFELNDQNGNAVSLSDFSGRKLLVFFYPKADTPGCTVQACSVRDDRTYFKNLGVAVIGISPDSPEKQKKFDEKHELGFPLLSDPEHETATAYGVWGEKKSYGRTYEGIIRSSFLIGESGEIIEAWYNISPKDTVPEAMKALKGE